MNSATLLAEMFFEGEGYCWFLTYIVYICQSFSHNPIIDIKLTTIRPRILHNILMGWFVGV